MKPPIGDLCVLRGDDHQSWVVSICRGHGIREELKQFDNQYEAIEFAFAERRRRSEETGSLVDVYFPDDCPCFWNEPRESMIP